MITQQIGYSILTAPLAAIDRRALSQAWYSALHLAREGSGAATPSPQQQLSKRRGAEPVRRTRDTAVTTCSSAPAATAARAGGTSRPLAEAYERRAGRCALARQIERAFLDPVRKTRRATFTFEGTHDGLRARVHVALRYGESGMHLVAVCLPSLRAGVARALDQARYTLAARGIKLTGVVQ
ncbi:MAG TPA: hypothetical protein VMG98_00190 [Verrucomicrobiae bacterium]|nr:hypothetical protein [Verrucomicrobiae bacterium]